MFNQQQTFRCNILFSMLQSTNFVMQQVLESKQSQPSSSMGAIITYQDNAGTNALNTDIVLQLSADGGSNYTTATLTALPDFLLVLRWLK